MNKTLLLLWWAGVAAGETELQAQGTFQNLDFEAARLVFLSPGSIHIATTNALPGWTAMNGSQQIADVPYVGAVGFFGLLGYGSAIDGSFSADLAGASSGTASISQTGLVPADAQSLHFKLRPSGAVAYRTTDVVSLGGQPLPLVTLSSGPGYTLYGADISRFAGQTETLSFYSKVALNGELMPFALDDIAFSPQIVPEPSVLALAGAAASLFLCRRFGGRSRQPRQVGCHGPVQQPRAMALAAGPAAQRQARSETIGDEL